MGAWGRDGRREGGGRFGRGRFGHGQFGSGRFGHGPVAWGALDSGWTAFAPGWAETAPAYPIDIPAMADTRRPVLPTAADLPVAGQRRSPVGPAVLFTIRDLSQGQSGRRSGARIISATEPTPLPGSSPTGRGGPLIIHLTAR